MAFVPSVNRRFPHGVIEVPHLFPCRVCCAPIQPNNRKTRRAATPLIYTDFALDLRADISVYILLALA